MSKRNKLENKPDRRGKDLTLNFLKPAFRNMKQTPRLLSLCLTTFIPHVTCLAIDQAPDSIATNSFERFRELLQNPPPIADVRFQRTQGFFNRSWNEHGKPNTNLTTYEGALQGTNYFLRHITNSIFDHVSDPRLGPLHGSTDRYFWELMAGQDTLIVVPRLPEEGGGTNNTRYQLNHSLLEMLDSVRRLSIVPLAGASIKWQATNLFVGSSDRYQFILGTVNRWTNGLPEQIVLECMPHERKGKEVHRVHFEYSSELGLIPVKTVYQSPHNSFAYTNVIERIRFGLENDSPRGYRPSTKRSRHRQLASFIIHSNQFRFFIATNGLWIPVDDTPLSTSTAFDLGSSQQDLAHLASGGAITIGFLIIVMRRLINKQTPTTKGKYL